MAQSDQRMVKNTVAGTESQGATSFSSEQHTKTNVRESADDWSLRPTDLSLGTDNIEKQPVIIDLDSQEDSDDEEVCNCFSLWKFYIACWRCFRLKSDFTNVGYGWNSR